MILNGSLCSLSTSQRTTLEALPRLPVLTPASGEGGRGPGGGLRGCSDALIGVSSVPTCLSGYYQDPSQGKISV